MQAYQKGQKRDFLNQRGRHVYQQTKQKQAELPERLFLFLLLLLLLLLFPVSLSPFLTFNNLLNNIKNWKKLNDKNDGGDFV